MLALTTPAFCQVTLFSDAFTRTTQPNDDIDADSGGMGGSVSPLVYVENGDTIAGGTGFTNIEGDALHLADGPNASALYLDHNFIDSDILTQGGFSVKLDLTSNDGTTSDTERWVGFGVGATADEFANQTQLDFGATAAEPALRGNFGQADSGFADLWVGYSPNLNGAIQVFKNGISTATYDNGGAGFGALSGQTLEVQYSVSDFNQGSQVGAYIFFDGIEVSQEVFTWDNTNENHIGINARQNGQGYTVDNLEITAQFVEPPAVPMLSIDSDTGNVTLQNLSNSPITLIGYAIQTSGGFDTSQWNQLDIIDDGTDNDSWELLTEDAPDGSGIPVNPATDLSEATLGAGYTIPAGGSLDFGDVWIRSPFGDFEFEFRDASGEIVNVVADPTFAPLALGDFDGMNGVDATDWAILRSNLISDPIEEGLLAYSMGDINVDGSIDGADFDEFKIAFDAANGAGAFQAMLQGTGVPEPNSVALVLLAGAGCALARSRRWVVGVAALLMVCLSTRTAPAQTSLFSDNFDRATTPQVDDIDATTTGITASFSLPSDVYIENGDDIVPAGALPTLTNIENNQLNMADGPNATSMYINHNFTEPAITSDGVLSISLDLVGNNGGATATENFVGFGVGSSLPEYQAQTLLDFNATTEEPAPRGNNTAGTGFADLWVGWSPSNSGTVQVVRNGQLMASFDDGVNNDNLNGFIQPGADDGMAETTPPALLELRMAVSDFNAGSTVPFSLYYNDSPVGGGAFRWDETNANYIGLNARQGDAGFAADNLSISTDTTPLEFQTLSLEVYTDTGEVFLVGGPETVTIDRYTISSNGGLENGNFNGIGNDSGLPAGDGSGNGWELGGVQTSSLLNEFYLGETGQGQSDILTSYRLPLGNIYDSAADTRDLLLEYRMANGDVIAAAAIYTTAPAGTPGDFNGDDIVNIADYTIWRNHLGASEGDLLNGNGNNDGTVNTADYNLWKLNFGSGSGAAAFTVEGQTNVPEPSTLLLAGTCVLLLIVRRKA